MVGFDDDDRGARRERTRCSTRATPARPTGARRRRRRRAPPHAGGPATVVGSSCSWSALAVLRRSSRAGVSVSPLLDVDHIQVRGLAALTAAAGRSDAAGIHARRLDRVARPERGRRAASRRCPTSRARRSRASGPTPCASRCASGSPVAWVDGPAGRRSSTAPAGCSRSAPTPPAGAAPAARRELVPAGRAAPIAPLDGARVAGALTGLAAGGHGVGRGHRPRRSCSTSRSGPEIRMGAATQVAVKVRAALAVLGALDGRRGRTTST